jgi:hypothetical protein
MKKLFTLTVLLLSSYPAWAQEADPLFTEHEHSSFLNIEEEEFYDFILDVAMDTPTCVLPNWLHFWLLNDYASAPKPSLAYLALCISGVSQPYLLTFRSPAVNSVPPRGVYGWYGRTRTGGGR